MPKASKADRNTVVDIILDSFEDNPSANWVLKDGPNKKKYLKALAEYSFDTAISRDGVYLSADGNGFAMCYPYNLKKEGLQDYWNQLKLVIGAVGIKKVGKVLDREAYIKKHRPEVEDFLYFWYLGVNKTARGGEAVYQLRDEIFEEAKKLKLPVFLETSVAQNKLVYERFGFETYHSLEVVEQGITLWFMKKEFDYSIEL